MTVLDVLTAAERIDPDAAHELLRITAFEALCDEVDRHRDDIEAQMVAEAVAKNSEVRRILVRKFIDARLQRVEVEPYLLAAAHLAEIDFEVAKAANDHWRYEPRNAGGQFTRVGAGNKRSRGQQSLDAVSQFVQGDPGQGSAQGSGDHWNQNDRYGRARTLGTMLNQVDHPAASGASLAAGLYGTFGPEAEDVLGPGLRRTAYRYRGTERRPDPALIKDMNFANRSMSALAGKDEGAKARANAVLASESPSGELGGKPFDGEKRGRPVGTSRTALVNHHRKGGYASTDQRMLHLQADVATHYLLDKIPAVSNAELSMTAGKVPPSQGVMIDADGHVVSQAVGYNGDHYLPFDLKNLKRLQGGQYVRTRVQGGPTTEDIYSGLVTGARQMTVASNTGVFTVEFDPDLRGSRRYNDKARQMVDRYKKILGTISAGDAKVGEALTPQQRRELKAQALEETNNHPQQAMERYKELEADAKAQALFLQDDDDEELTAQAKEKTRAEAEATLRSGAKQGQYSAQAMARDLRGAKGELRQEAADRRYRTLQLDGPGYFRAMQALQEEFPYFIRNVNYVPLEKFQSERGLVDPSSGEIPRSSIRGTDSGFVREQKGEIAFRNTGRRKKSGAPGRQDDTTQDTDTTTSDKTPARRTAVEDHAVINPALAREMAPVTSFFKANAGEWSEHDLGEMEGTQLKDVVGHGNGFVKWLSTNRVMPPQLIKSFQGLDESHQEQLIDTLQTKMASSLAFKNPGPEYAQNGKDLAAMLRVYKPFRTGDVEDAPTDAPLAFPDIEEAYPSVAKLDKIIKDSADHTFTSQVGAYRTASTDDIKTDIEDTQDQMQLDPDNADLVKTLKIKQKAWSFVHARALAAKHGVSGKAGAPLDSGLPARESVGAGFGKRDDRFLRALAVLRGE
jgi:hypothetical protein